MDTSSEAWRSAAAQVLVADLADPGLDRDAAHHLSRVLRLRDGAEVCATDGAGGWRSCRFDGRSALAPTGQSRAEAPPPYPLELPEGWAIEVERPIRFAFNGICEGGTLTLRAPGRPPEKLLLEPPLCKAVAGGA